MHIYMYIYIFFKVVLEILLIFFGLIIITFLSHVYKYICKTTILVREKIELFVKKTKVKEKGRGS